MTYQHIHRRLLSAALCLTVGWLACLPAYAQELAEPAGLQPGDRYHRVFVTSEPYAISTSTVVPPAPGTFGGLAAADWNVNSHADSAGLITDWNGSDIPYRAILSDFTGEARTRLSITGPVYNTANEIIANDFEDFWDGSLINPIRYEEKSDSPTRQSCGPARRPADLRRRTTPSTGAIQILMPRLEVPRKVTGTGF